MHVDEILKTSESFKALLTEYSDLFIDKVEGNKVTKYYVKAVEHYGLIMFT